MAFVANHQNQSLPRVSSLLCMCASLTVILPPFFLLNYIAICPLGAHYSRLHCCRAGVSPKVDNLIRPARALSLSLFVSASSSSLAQPAFPTLSQGTSLNRTTTPTTTTLPLNTRDKPPDQSGSSAQSRASLFPQQSPTRSRTARFPTTACPKPNATVPASHDLHRLSLTS